MTRRGTTPTHIFTPKTRTGEPVDLTSAQVVYMTYKQNGRIAFEKTKDEMEITEDTITINLTQEDTLALCDRFEVEIECRARYADQQAIASCIIKTSVNKILKEGVI